MMDSSKQTAAILLGLFFGLASCSSGTVDQAKEIYRKHRELFHAMYAEIHSQPALARVENGYDPYDEDSIRFLQKFGPFTDDTRKTYNQILAQMSEAEVLNIIVARERVGDGTNVELVDFRVFDRGRDNDTEGISILAVHDAHPKIDPRCSAVGPPVWFVCYWK